MTRRELSPDVRARSRCHRNRYRPGLSCSGAPLVSVKGSALTSYAGIGGIATTLLGIAGVALAGLGSATHVSPFRVAFGAIAGLIAALGVLVLLQEAAVLYPTMLVAIIGLALGVGIGAVVALRWRSVMQPRRARWERA